MTRCLSTLNLDLHLSQVDEERAKLNQEYHQYMKTKQKYCKPESWAWRKISKYMKDLQKKLNEELDKEYKEFTKRIWR